MSAETKSCGSFLYLDHQYAHLCHDYGEYSTRCDIGQHRRQNPPDWVLEINKRFVPVEIFRYDFWYYDPTKMPLVRPWEDARATKERVAKRPTTIGLVFQLRRRTEKECVAEAKLGRPEALVARYEDGKRLGAEARRVMADLALGKLKNRPDRKLSRALSGSERERVLLRALWLPMLIAEPSKAEIIELLSADHRDQSGKVIEAKAHKFASDEVGRKESTLKRFMERRDKSRLTPPFQLLARL